MLNMDVTARAVIKRLNPETLYNYGPPRRTPGSKPDVLAGMLNSRGQYQVP